MKKSIIGETETRIKSVVVDVYAKAKKWAKSMNYLDDDSNEEQGFVAGYLQALEDLKQTKQKQNVPQRRNN